MERGVRRPTPRVLDVADEMCGAEGMLSAAKEFLDRERYSPRAQDLMDREKEAISRWSYDVSLVPGLLQTKGYARALIDSRIPPLDEETVEERIAGRMERQSILTERKPPVGLSFVLYEAALRAPQVDAEQLRHLLDVGRLRNVVLQVLPFERAIPAALIDGPVYTPVPETFLPRPRSGGLPGADEVVDVTDRVDALRRAAGLGSRR